MTSTKTNTDNSVSLFTKKVSAVGGIIETPNFGDGVKRTNSEIGKIIQSGQKITLSPLDNRKRIIQDYFDLYVKSGIIDYITKEIRKDLNIPKLNASEDYQLIPQSDTNGASYDLEVSYWYESLIEEKQKVLNTRLYNTLKLLYLPRSAFDMLLHYCLYKEKLRSYPFYDRDMINCIAEGTIPENEFLGYSKNEVEFLKAEAILLLGSKREMVKNDPDLSEEEKLIKLAWIEKQMRLVPKRCKEILKNYERRLRPLRTLKEDIQIIKKMKLHKQPYISEGDMNRPEDLPTVGSHTSKDIAEMIDENIDYPFPRDKKQRDNLDRAADDFRQQKSRLIKKYPFLEEFIKSS